MTADILLSILATSLFPMSEGSKCHSFFIAFFNWWILEALCSATLNLRSFQRFSIGFRSGEHAGQGRTLILFWSFHVLANNDLCLGSLSSWRIQSELEPLNKCAAEGMRWLINRHHQLGIEILCEEKNLPNTRTGNALPCMNFCWMLDSSSYRAKVWAPPHLSF